MCVIIITVGNITHKGVSMKRLTALLFCTMLYSFIGAQEYQTAYQTNISSFEITGNNYAVDTDLLVSSVNYISDLYRITITNSDPSVSQNVTFYQWGNVGTSTSLVRGIWYEGIVGGASYTTSASSRTIINISNKPITEDFSSSPIPFTHGIAVRKSNPSSTVGVSIIYKGR